MSFSSLSSISTVEYIIPTNCTYIPQNNGTLQEFSPMPILFLQLAIVRLIKELVIPLVVPLLLTVLCCHLWEVYNDCTSDRTCQLPLPPGGYGFPVFGETVAFLLQGRKFFDKRRDTYGNIYKTHMLGKPTIRIIGIKNIKKILSAENNLVTSQWPKSVKLLLGEGSLTVSNGTIHNVRKKAIFRAFTNSALEGYTKYIQTITKNHIEQWCSAGNVLGYKEFKSLTFEISCAVLLGIKMDKTEKMVLMSHFDDYLANLFSIPLKIPGLGFHKGVKARKILLDKIGACIEEKQQNGPFTGFQDALSLLMDISGSGKLSLSEMKDMGLELLFAGHETTASACTSIMIELSKNTNIISRIQQELKTFRIDSNNCYNVDFETLNKMTYLNNVVKEAIRFTPPVGGGYREALETFEIDGYQIPKGWTVAYSIRDTHELGNELVLNPDSFNPDRWNSLQGRDNEHFLAFGGGKKGCAGRQFALMMLKIFTLEIVRSCTWSIPNPNPTIKYIPVPHPTDNLPITFTALT